MSVGIVLVSHSRALAEAALDLARRLIVAVDVPVETAAGLADGGWHRPRAVVEAWSSSPSAARRPGSGDLGSGIMSAEMALEMLDPALAERTRSVGGALRRRAARCLRRGRHRQGPSGRGR